MLNIEFMRFITYIEAISKKHLYLNTIHQQCFEINSTKNVSRTSSQQTAKIYSSTEKLPRKH